jgi:hypothetical protein
MLTLRKLKIVLEISRGKHEFKLRPVSKAEALNYTKTTFTKRPLPILIILHHTFTIYVVEHILNKAKASMMPRI